MPVSSLITASIETAINSLQKLDAMAAARRDKLSGLVFSVEIKEIGKPLFFVISRQQIDVLSRFEGQPDCIIRLSAGAIDDLKDSSKTTQLILEEKLEVEGDIQKVQQFGELLTEMEIDWEEHLSHYVGDILAHKACYGAKQLKNIADAQFFRMHKNAAAYVTEELRLAPGPLEVACFCDDVEQLQRDFDAVNKRVETLIKKAVL